MSTDRKRLLEKDFKYVRASDTDLAKSFAKIKKKLKENEAALHNAAHTVCELKRKAAK